MGPRMSRIRQYGTINTLIGGLFDGTFEFDGLFESDEIGLGAFHALDGEMIFFDGTCYQVLADGSVRVADTKGRTPYATFGSFKEPRTFDLEGIDGFDVLSGRLDAALGDLNRPALVRVDGRFSRLKTRSIHSQSKPYQGFTAVVKSQEIFERSEVEGTILGVRFPEYLQVLQVAGWHLHALSSDATFGGHLLEIHVDVARVTIESADSFEVHLPDTEAFREAILPIDVHAEVQGAERDPTRSNESD